MEKSGDLGPKSPRQDLWDCLGGRGSKQTWQNLAWNVVVTARFEQSKINSSKILLNSSMAPRLKEIKQEINDSSLILDVISFLLFPQASEQVRILIYQKWSI